LADLDGRRALVTGGSRGIGRGIALVLAGCGASLVITYRRAEEEAASAVAEIEALGGRALALKSDASDIEQVEDAFARANEFLGGLDTVVANAGLPSGVAPVSQVEPRYWRKVLDTNLDGVFYTLRTAVPYIEKAGGGSIIAISSIAADNLMPFGSPYNVAKAGVNALTLTLAKEVASSGIRVNVVAPGLVKSAMGDAVVNTHGEAALASIALGRIGQPDDIGRMVAFLASSDGDWITGKVLRVDGGQYIHT